MKKQINSVMFYRTALGWRCVIEGGPGSAETVKANCAGRWRWLAYFRAWRAWKQIVRNSK